MDAEGSKGTQGNVKAPRKGSIIRYAVVALVAGLLVGAGATYAVSSRPAPTPATITLVSEGHEGGNLGTDGLLHDTVIPANFTVHVGQAVTLTIINYDEGPHTFTSDGLGVNFHYPGAQASGVPSVTSFTFTATKQGVFRWYCNLPCDGGQGGWAMHNGADGQTGQMGFMGGFVTVLA